MSVEISLPSMPPLPRLALAATFCMLAAGISLAMPAHAAKLLAKPAAPKTQLQAAPAADPALPKVQLLTPKTVKLGLKSTLQVTAASGDMQSWVAAIKIDTRRKVAFLWSTGKGAYSGAIWQVGRQGSEEVIGSGPIGTGPFQAEKHYDFLIDFKTLLPVMPPSDASATRLWVKVVPQANGQALVASSPVEIRYARPSKAPDAAPVFGFDHDLFAYNLTAQLDGKTAGYAYAIYQGQTLKKAGAGGFAIRSTVAMTPDRRMSIASSSKTITAAAVMRAIEIMKARGEMVSIDSPIASYLPSDWALGPHVADIKIKDLLRHTSGLRQGGSQYEELKQTIATGPSTTEWAERGSSPYCNCNFSIFRIIIPYMVHGRSGMEGSADAVQAKNPAPAGTLAGRTSQLYVSFVQDEVLAKVGMGNVWINPRGPAETIHYYNMNDPTKVYTGHPDEEAITNVGAGFWFMSAKELAKFGAALRSGKIVSQASWQTMVANRLGMYSGSSAGGQSWSHNGAFSIDLAGGWAVWMTFPGGVTAAILYNSTTYKEVDGEIMRSDDGFPVDAMRAEAIVTNAYNAAFAMEQLQP